MHRERTKAHSRAQEYILKEIQSTYGDERVIKQIGAGKLSPGGKLYDRYLKLQIRPDQGREPTNAAALRD